MAKVALLIGVSDYQISGSNQGFTDLPSARLDVEGMKRILKAPELGAFDEVKDLMNPTHYAMGEDVETFLSDRQKDDLVLLYFSGHGAKDKNRKLYFAAKGTRKNFKDELVTATAVSAQTVREWLDGCRATKKIMILDCCFSGAIDPNAKGDDTLEALEASLSAVKGSIILTSSSSTEISYGDPTQMSFYTRYFVQGIENGEADRDSTGYLSIHELHHYVKNKLQVEQAKMNPKIFFLQEDGFYAAPLIRVPIADPKQVYRKKIEAYIDREVRKRGEFDFYTKAALKSSLAEINQLSRIPLSSNDAEAIENEILQPIKQRLESQKSYRDAFRGHLEKQDLEQHSVGLQRWAKDTLKLTDADIAEIEQAEQQRLTAKKARDESVVKPTITPTPATTNVEPSSSAPLASNDRSVERVTPSPQRALRQVDPTFKFEVVTVDAKGQIVDRHQREAAYRQEDLSKGITLDLVVIPGGKFLMGSPTTETGHGESEVPQHEVSVSSFLMGKYPVTQAQWKVVAALPKIKTDMKPDPSRFKGVNRPVEQVSWNDAVEFCARLSKQTDREHRLPSEAEWEYACRAGTTTPFYFGETLTPKLARCKSNLGGFLLSIVGVGETADVGSFPPNAFGLYDMHGNVSEWCLDHWHGNYEGAPIDGSDWLTEGKTAKRLMRGGSWFTDPVNGRSACRDYDNPDYCHYFLGFRVVCGLA